MAEKCRQHYNLATGQKSQNSGETSTPSKRFYAEGGFVRHGNMAHTTHGAPGGYANKVSGGCKRK